MVNTDQISLKSLQKDIADIKREVHEVREAVVGTQLSDEDLEFNRRVKKAWKDIDEGKAITMPKEEFLRKLESRQ